MPSTSSRATDAAAHAEELRELDRLAGLLDSRFRIPGTPIRFGLDSALGLIPGIGDLAALGPSAYLVYRGWKMGARRRTLGRMAVNTGIDFVVGGVPLFGDIFDVAFKANRRNAAILRADLSSRAVGQMETGGMRDVTPDRPEGTDGAPRRAADETAARGASTADAEQRRRAGR